MDPSQHILGLRLNLFVATALCLAGATWFVGTQWGGGTPLPTTAAGVDARAVHGRRGSARSRRGDDDNGVPRGDP